MAYRNPENFSVTLIIVAFLAFSFQVHGRILPSTELSSSSSSLMARLKLDQDGESPSCWDSLIQLQACTGEIIFFFLNGETYLGHSCCQALLTISQQCWPSVVDTLGFTTDEANVLEGYCVLAADSDHPSPPHEAMVHAHQHQLIKTGEAN